MRVPKFLKSRFVSVIVIMVALLVINATAAVFILVGKCSNEEVHEKDNGALSVKIEDYSVPLFLWNYPPTENDVVWDIIVSDDIDYALLLKAVSTWRNAVGKRVFSVSKSVEYYRSPFFILAGDPTIPGSSNYRRGTITFSISTTPHKDGCGGTTSHFYTKEGKVLWVDIQINKMYTYNKRIYQAAIAHELGHALLLADDENHRTSIMNETLNINGIVTSRDKALVRTLWRNSQKRPYGSSENIPAMLANF